MENFKAVEILIVEDNPQDAELTLRALRKNNLANSVFVAEDGEEALDFFFCRGKFISRSFENPPKIVLLDLKLPKVSGLEVLRTVKSDTRTRHIPIVIVTSSREEPDIKEAYNLGVNSYVIKPVDFDQFVNAMSSLGLYWLLINEPAR
ncbi:MAG TPA: response regulator [Bacteroidales bacterium]|nr:two-component system response regulator [Bacteroidales bacterium]HOU95618.1 response regulator [Bacteroidales bacterium]HQG36607.1 response regulator [Bacteroidales bacterium]HQG53221.1 response regulator [Bacteroidales bacterium]HQJ20601.1 response regulator [Bacteroidales bacterium]